MKFNFPTVAFVLLSCVAYMAVALRGIDVAGSVSTSTFDCLKKQQRLGDFAIVRIGRSTGTIDVDGAQTIKNAHAAGISQVDGYIFPCPRCGDPEGQVKRAIQHVREQGASIGRLWLDVEGSNYWTTQTANRDFFNKMVQAGHAAGIPLGVYTSASQWTPIMGNWDGGKAYPLWYAHYDHNESFNDFKAFGGWQHPWGKQFNGDVMVCGQDVDTNWRP